MISAGRAKFISIVRVHQRNRTDRTDRTEREREIYYIELGPTRADASVPV